MTVYQVLPRLWGNGTFSSFDVQAFDYLKSLGVSHVWYTGVIRHASGKDFVKGNAGSPYAISDYYDVNPYLADDEACRMQEFEALLARTHDAGLKVLIDFVPNHVARDYDRSALPLFDWCDYDWTDTLKIDYNAPGAWDKMYGIVRFWAMKGVDGMRCDMVELVPPEFFKWLIARIKGEFPEFVFIAEVYHKELYRKYVYEVGFDYLYDKSGLYDVLASIVHVNRESPDGYVDNWQSARNITWNWQFLGDLQPHMLNFLENHDEVRFASREFGGSASRTFAPLAASALFNTAPFMIYFGEEIGVDASESSNCRTSIFDFGHVPVMDGLSSADDSYVSKFRYFMKLAASPLCTEGFSFDLCYCNMSTEGFSPERHFAFMRHLGDETIVVFCNFSARGAHVQLNIPELAFEVLGLDRTRIPHQVYVSAPAYDAVVISL